MIKNNILLTLISLAVLTFNSCNFITVNPEISTEELKSHIEFLASDSLKGRYPGTPEDKVAANYIAQEFKNSGLELLFDKGLQPFDIQSGLKLGENNSFQFNDITFQIKEDYTPISFSTNAKLEAQLSFAGYGFQIKNGTHEWNDYENMDVKDKLVIILIGEPDLERPIPFARHSSLRSKAIKAKDLGAAGVLFVANSKHNQDDQLIELEKPEGRLDIPIIQIKRKVVNQLLAKTGYNLEQLEQKINDTKSPKSFEINETVSLNTEVNINYKQTYNIAAQLISNPNNKEYIVIGAHYDHLGFGGVGSGSRDPNSKEIHYGADDNASGVASVLEIAEKLASNKDSLNANFIFAAFGAEEMGLLGSKHFTTNLPVPDSLIKAMINIDMLGRMKKDKSLQVGGVGTAPQSEAILNDINTNYELKLGLSFEGYGPSDHSSFYSMNIPVFFFSTGAHIDYHTPGDSLGNINFEGMKLANNYIYNLSYQLASTNTQLTFKEAGPKSPEMGGRRDFKVTLGIMPDFSSVEKRGLRADIVIKDKPADKAGLKNGDIIVAMNGFPVSDVYEYMERLSKLKAGQIITVEVLRNDKKEVFIVQL